VGVWALKCGAKAPLAWTDAHEETLRLADRLWDDLRWIWILGNRYQAYREDATGDVELLESRAAHRTAEAAVDAAFAARRAWRQRERRGGSTPEIEAEIDCAIRRRRETRSALASASKRVRKEIREDLARIWRARDRAMQDVACGVGRRYPELHDGVYNDVLARFRTAAHRAAKIGRVVRRSAEHPARSLYVQFPGGRAWVDLCKPSTRAHLAEATLSPRVANRWRLLRLRANAAGLMAEVPIRVDREPAEGSRVKGVRLVRDGREWYAVFSIDGPVLTPIVKGAGTLYVGTNWRQMRDGSLRTLAGVDEGGLRVEVCLPPEHAESARYADLLQSALDLAADGVAISLGESAAEIRRRRDWPALRRLAMESADADLVTWVRGEHQGRALHDALLEARRRANGDAEKYATECAWILGDAAGRRRVEGMRAQAMRRREDLYRRAARWICERYGRVVIAESDGRDLARVLDTETGQETPLPLSARRARQYAAPYSLESAVRWAATRAAVEYVERPAVDMSHRCPICQSEMHRSEADRARLVLRCEEHGEWDRDHALALALWRAEIDAARVPEERERWDWHAEAGERSRARIVRVDMEVEARLRGGRPAHSRLRYASGVALADRSDS
jgi:hypothetical protein